MNKISDEAGERKEKGRGEDGGKGLLYAQIIQDQKPIFDPWKPTADLNIPIQVQMREMGINKFYLGRF